LGGIKLEHLNWLPDVLVALIERRQGMSLTTSLLAKTDPFFWSSFFVPCIISGENLDSWHIRWTKYLIFFAKKFDCFLSRLIFVYSHLFFVKESLFLLDVVMLLDDICMSGR
jgi:hypothetical protein